MRISFVSFYELFEFLGSGEMNRVIPGPESRPGMRAV